MATEDTENTGNSCSFPLLSTTKEYFLARVFCTLCVLGVLSGSPAFASPAFHSSEIAQHSSEIAELSGEIPGRTQEIISCDLDGDKLKEIVLMDGLDLRIFYQDAKEGFTREPQQVYRLDRPCVVWTGRLAGNTDSLLVMSRDGVDELCFTNRNAPPERRHIIRQPTIIPEVLQATNVGYVPLCANTDGGRPLLLLPVAEGLQVWSVPRPESAGAADAGHRDEWRMTQLIQNVVNTHVTASVTNPGYTESIALNMSVNDLSGDRRDDLMVRRRDQIGREVFTLYVQNADGRFATEPALTYTNQADLRTWICWLDLNRDGKVDLIKSTWVDEPSFIPGIPSGKVVVRIFMADARGKIPAEPQATFRKSDWLTQLPVVDVDGDGSVDLVLGYSVFDKDGIRKQLTNKRLDFNLKFFFNRPGAGFPKVSDCQRDLELYVDGFMLLLSWRQRAYFARSVELDGDFNGDGKKDLLVRDKGDQISVHFFSSRERGFNQNTDLTFSCPETIDWMMPRDLNGDGVSDLIVKLRWKKLFRVFTSGK